ncbi:hypothetical protein [Sphingobacterium sp. HMA12]|uniref:hypothetical protein n=1 Tax=Sphingobacterium sp. HMA12 TaxID=2050894 RepID=UPI000CE9BEF5|nr:hypothetical protein [Sphingobacterium sp. HMA12]
MYERLKHLVSPLFIFFLVLLIINDFFLKAAFPNTFTGKLSDFSGLFIFPIFCSAIFPKQKLLIFISTAVLFVFWKSEYSSDIIQFMKPYLHIGRTVDFSDLIALPMLLLAWFYTKRDSQQSIGPALMTRWSSYFIGAAAIFSFCATSQQRYFQSFDQPQYVLLKDPTIQDLNSHDEFEFYNRDSLLVVKINYLSTGRPVRNDDYNKNRSVNTLDIDVLHRIADSASLVASEKITLLTVNTEQGIDSLRFNGGRLDGRFIRTKGGKPIIEGFYKMGLEDSTWIIRDTIRSDKVIKTFVNGETTNIKYYRQDQLQSSSNINTRSDTIFNTYMQLAILILCMAGICFLLYRNYRRTVPNHLKFKLPWRLLLCFVSPFVVWLFYIGIMLLLMNYNQDTFDVLATGIFIFIAICPLMFVIVFGIKLRKEIDIFLYYLLLALACSILTTYFSLESLSI